ncbi:hypothetical protein NADFUDRAFT_81163 [Nadsonia fulvescens var. elongata DSM 6958]|uniref:DNA repair protein rhp7 treble clef domain-containing protein n=1 Tax=Nadsonia fulvescens var. elongata DSM 6958 TaxID=857566 RepID=A0A1E3PRY6_9ASCO|nr:hypothetical protein NADFUDRAFT_81163 [Nadsonia fulvescens var. elongata DSM 6958]
MSSYRRRQTANSNGSDGTENNSIRGPNSALTSFLREQGITAEGIRQRNLARQQPNNRQPHPQPEPEDLALNEDLDSPTPDVSSDSNTVDGNGVRGPSSALTAFLRQQGITSRQRRRNSPLQSSSSELEPREEQLDDAEVAQIRQAARLKRKRLNDEDADYNDDDSGVPKFQPGKIEFCYECNNRFTITVYTEHSSDALGLLCHKCGKASSQANVKDANRRKEVSKIERVAKKKRKQIAQALLNKIDVVNVPKLQDLCIKLILDYIDDVEVLGDIGMDNLAKINKILSKNRVLNANSMKLFLSSDLTKLEFFDCSKLGPESYSMIAAYCPNLQELRLEMCGQLSNENLLYFATHLKHLKHIYLDGPFLIRSETWNRFFEICGDRLVEFHVRNSHRFNNDNLLMLSERCGLVNLRKLTLGRVDGIDDMGLFEFSISNFKHLQSLEISNPLNEALISNDILIGYMAQYGINLQSLILNGCSGLGDRFILEGLLPFGRNLSTLSLDNLDQISESAMTQLFSTWANVQSTNTVLFGKDEEDNNNSQEYHGNNGLINLSLNKCIQLGDTTLKAIFSHSFSTLVEFNYGGNQHTTEEGFGELIKYLKTDTDLRYMSPNLTHLNLGFTKFVNDLLIETFVNQIFKGCLKIVEVYGCNRVTANCNVLAEGPTKLIGRQSDTI